MPVTAIQICQIEKVLPLAVKWLGVQNPNSPDGAGIASGAPYTLLNIKELLFQTDYEICLLIVENLEHPFRTKFVTEETGWLADGALVPPHFGPHSQVIIRIDYGDDEPEDFDGQQRTWSRLKRLRKNPKLFGSPSDLYAIWGGRIHFSDKEATAKLDIPRVTKDETYTALNTPLPYFWAIIAGAIVKAGMKGFPENHRRYWATLWQRYEQMIKGGAVAIPEPEQLEQLED